MTREEAVKHLTAWIYTDFENMPKHVLGALNIALAALRPVSREQVEKVWRGGWKQGGYACGEHEWECSKCHETEWRTSCSRLKFCPFCGAPMTDEAVQRTMERLEALHERNDE